MTKVAPKYGLSDVGLAKVCTKHQIPRPPVGHWAKLEHGKATSKPELPELDEADLQEIHFFRVSFERDVGQKDAKPKTPNIPVKEDLRKPHRLVDRARAKLRAEQEDHRGFGRCSPVGVVVCSNTVTPPRFESRWRCRSCYAVQCFGKAAPTKPLQESVARLYCPYGDSSAGQTQSNLRATDE